MSVQNTEQLLIAMQQCIEHGINEKMASAAVVFGDFEMIEQLSARLLQLVVAQNTAARRHRSGVETRSPVREDGHIQPALVGYLVTMMVERCAENQLPPPLALARLLRAHLGVDLYAAGRLKASGAFYRAVRYYLAHPKASAREIGRYAGVSHVMINQWKTDGALAEAGEQMKRAMPLLAEWPSLAVLDERKSLC
jgi:hypothetical protein